MRVLIVYCHPDPASYTAAIRDEALRGLARAGHETRLIDLYDEGFEAVLSRDERQRYHDEGANAAAVGAHLDLLRWCEALVFIYPTWWYAQPAMLKGWLDRVWIPFETFRLPENGKPIARVLTNIRRVAVVTTLGSPLWWWRVVGAPGRHIILRGVAALCHPRVKRSWIALHSIDTASDAERAIFLARVRRAVESFT